MTNSVQCSENCLSLKTSIVTQCILSGVFTLYSTDFWRGGGGLRKCKQELQFKPKRLLWMDWLVNKENVKYITAMIGYAHNSKSGSSVLQVENYE